MLSRIALLIGVITVACSTAVGSFYEDNPTYPAPGAAAEPWKTATPESQGLRSATLDAGAASLERLPQSLSFLVLRNGVLVQESYFNGSRMTDSNNVHSASKSIVSLLVGIAVREGFIKSIDQSVKDFLAKKFTVTKAKQAITVRHLLTMSAGLDWTEDETENQIEKESNWVQAILDLPLKTKAGRTFNYDTGLTHLLSAILTEASGMPLHELAAKYLFRPLGITFQHWGHDPLGYDSGGYNLYLAPRELLKIGELYLQGGVWNGSAVVPREWIASATKPSKTVDSVYSYGYLCWLLSLHGHAVYKMWGYGGQFVYVIPDLDLVTVLTADTKKEYDELDADDFVARYVLSAVAR